MIYLTHPERVAEAMAHNDPLPLAASESRASSGPGDLNAAVVDGRVTLPRDIFDALARLRVRDAEELLVYAESFPSAVAATLHWSVPEVQSGVTTLRRQLGRPSSSIDVARPRPATGAFDPRTY
jgi:hypothetical protein